jgi:hypothetical protein
MPPGPKASGLPRKKPIGVALSPKDVERLDLLLEIFLQIAAVIHEKGVVIPGLPTTRSSLMSFMIQDGFETAYRSLVAIKNVHEQKGTPDDIAHAERSQVWHLVNYHFPDDVPFPAAPEGLFSSASTKRADHV